MYSFCRIKNDAFAGFAGCPNSMDMAAFFQTMDAVVPLWGNMMQFMQFPNLHLYSPICARRIGATFFHMLPRMASPSSNRPEHSGS